jgi:carboxyl-terminal processing protease
VVYGGGGIMPDVFIPWDSTPISDYYLDLRRKNIINTYVSSFVDKSRNSLKASYPEFSVFNLNFQIDDAFMDDFFTYAEKEGVKKDEKGYAASEKLIRSQLKGLIAQKLWDMTELYTIINQDDEVVLKAIEVVEDDALFQKLQIDR